MAHFLDEIIEEQERIQGKDVMRLIRDVAEISNPAWDNPCPVNLENEVE